MLTVPRAWEAGRMTRAMEKKTRSWKKKHKVVGGGEGRGWGMRGEFNKEG